MKKWLLLLLLLLPTFAYAQQGVPEYNVNCALSTQLNTDGLVCIQTATTPPDARGPVGQSRVQGHTYLWSLNTSLFTDITAGGGAGTITGVTPGGGLTGGGTVGNVTLSMAPQTNHSIFVGSGTNTPGLIAPGTSGWCLISNGSVLNPSFQACPGGGGGGSVTSVGLSMPSGFTVTNSPVTGAGTLTVTTTLNGMLKGTGSAFTTGTSGTDYVAPGLATSSGLTVSAASLLGRSSSGALQEITMGTGMTLSGTTLSSAVTTSGNYAWTGTNSWLSGNWSLLDSTTPTKILKWDISGFTAATTRTIVLPNASTRLIGDSDFSTTGLMTRTAANTYAGRTFTAGVANEFILTNPDGVAGNPTIALGSLAVKNNQSNTYTTGDQSFASAASLTLPIATGAAPTLSGRCAYDSTANRLKCGFNGTTVTLAITSEIQPLNGNLTALAALTGANNQLPTFTGAGAMTLTTLPPCIDSGGNHLNYDTATRTWSCGNTSTGGISGLTTGTIPKATSATTIGNSIVTDSGTGTITVGGNLTVGTGSFFIPSTASLTADRTYTVQDAGGLLVPCITTPTITDGHVVVFGVTAGVVTCKDGGAAGSGTWTDSSTNTGSNKTLVATGAGGTNTITTPVIVSWDGGSLTADGTNCQDPVKVTINSGPTQYVILCATAASAQWDAVIVGLKQTVSTFTLTLTVNDTLSSSHVYAGTFKAQCRASGTAPSSTWGTTQTVAITMTTANNNYTGTTSAITANGSCSANSTLYLRFNANGSMTDAGTARVIGLTFNQAS